FDVSDDLIERQGCREVVARAEIAANLVRRHVGDNGPVRHVPFELRDNAPKIPDGHGYERMWPLWMRSYRDWSSRTNASRSRSWKYRASAMTAGSKPSRTNAVLVCLKVAVTSKLSRMRRKTGRAYSGRRSARCVRKAARSSPSSVTMVAMPARPSAPGMATP